MNTELTARKIKAAIGFQICSPDYECAQQNGSAKSKQTTKSIRKLVTNFPCGVAEFDRNPHQLVVDLEVTQSSGGGFWKEKIYLGQLSALP